jgi:hypothetical protein
MWVYGDRPRRADPRGRLAALAGELISIEAAPAGVERHGRQAGALMLAGELFQGLADADFEAQGGVDRHTPMHAAAGALLMKLASGLVRSWDTAFCEAGPSARSELRALASFELPAEATFKTGEGFAFYAVYPETYLAAARFQTWARPPQVLGLRSIGASLAAMVAVGAQSQAPLSARPLGPPFDRRLSLAPEVAARLAEGGDVAVVDEGPGLSGSSFGAAADLLLERGVSPDRLVFFPSHPGAPGPQALERHRRRWAAARRAFVSFDALIVHDPVRGLARWFADVLGEPTAPLQEISGGAWRAGRDLPAVPAQERRKFLMRTERGVFLLKFIGLGPIGAGKFARARQLHAAGFAPEPLALRHGFLAEPWLEHARPLSLGGAQLIEVLGRYLALRAAMPAPADAAAVPETLHQMLAANLPLILGREVRLSPPPGGGGRPVRIDGRLHPWEWLRTPDGRVFKTDGLDHDDAHDLVGCQDIAWDVAGAEVEFDLAPTETDVLVAELEARTGRRLDRRLLDFHRLAYPTFQAALWSGAEPGRAVKALQTAYRRRIEVALAGRDVAV